MRCSEESLSNMNDYCIKCGRKLTQDEKSLYRKLIKRTAEEFVCISCMAKHFRVDEKLLYDRIKIYRDMGCCLFGTADKTENKSKS